MKISKILNYVNNSPILTNKNLLDLFLSFTEEYAQVPNKIQGWCEQNS